MGIPVSKILEDREFDLRLQLLAGRAGLNREIRHTRLETPGLALAGKSGFVDTDRVQVLGVNEMGFLETERAERRTEALRRYLACEPACVVVVDELPVPSELSAEAEARGVPLLTSSLRFGTFTDRLTDFLQEHLGETCTLHGVLVDVLGVGVLILGKSGIGKSECALDLVLRGHRLVADDLVQLKKRPPASVFGSSSPLLKHHMEIRGLGIINIKDLYGVSAVRERKKVELVAELVAWEEVRDEDRLGVEDRTYNILEVEIPHLVIPVRPERNITTLVEVAARNLLLKLQGHHSAREFKAKLDLSLHTDCETRVLGEEVE